MRGSILTCSAALGAMCAIGCLQMRDTPRPATFSSVREFVEKNPLKAGAPPIRLFAQGEYQTVNIVTPLEPLKAHYHETHEETVYLAKGKGVMRIGAEQKQMKAGDLAHIPKRLVHSFTPKSKDCLAISVFGPAFDGKDRIYVDD